jgi:probable rRNA maturation factor
MPTPVAEPLPAGDPHGGDHLVVEVCSAQGVLEIDADRLSGLARRVLRGEGITRASISLALADDATLHRLNREHLHHDWPTDVISFVLSDPDESELTGEVVVSAEMAVATAAQVAADPWAELALYVVHGLLHLCGYDDTTADAASAMRAAEDRALKREGLTNTFRLTGSLADGEQWERAACSS